MAEPYKEDGRKVRGLNEEVEFRIGKASRLLDSVAWQRDPAKIGLAFAQAQEELDEAKRAVAKIEKICAIAASHNGGTT